MEVVTGGFEDSIFFFNDIMNTGYINECKKCCDMGLEMQKILKESEKAIHAKVVIIDEETVFILVITGIIVLKSLILKLD